MTARLRDAVDRLTRDRPETIQTDSGTRYTQSTALLTQLATCWLDTGSSGHGGGDTAQPTIHVPAHDLLVRIGAEVDELLRGCQVRPQLNRKLAPKIRSYGAAILAYGEHEAAEAERIVTGWVYSAENILRPPKKRRPLGQPCPACDNLWVLGENGRVAAVTLGASEDNHYTTWEANCLACNAAWTGLELAYLLRAGDAA